MPHKNRVRRQTHVGSAPELLGEIEMTFSFGTFPKALAKLFPSRARRLFWSRRAPHGGQQGTDQLWKKSGNRPAQVHSTSTARWRFCHPVFGQVHGLIDRRRLKLVLPSGLFFADFTKNFRCHCRSCWVYASRERHGRHNLHTEEYYPMPSHTHPFLVLPHALALQNFRNPERHNTPPN